MLVMFRSECRIKFDWIIFIFVVVQCALRPQNVSATVFKQEGDTCLIEGELQGICTNYQQCRSAQDLIRDGTRSVPCNPQIRDTDLVCCAERGRREISHERHRGNNNYLQSTQSTPTEEALDEIETIYDVKNVYESRESGRKKNSIPPPSLSTRQKIFDNHYQKPNNPQQPVYVSQVVRTTTQRNPVRRPINEHTDLDLYEDGNRGSYHPEENSNQRWDTTTRRWTSTTSRYEEPYHTTRKPPNYRPQHITIEPFYQEQTTRRHSQKTTASDWQEPPRPLVEDPDGYLSPNYYRPTTTTSKPKREKRISEIKCKEYSELVTETIAGLPLTTDPKPIEISIQKCNYNAQKLIVGGQNTSVGEFPHMAAIGFLDQKRRTINWNCGGTLISENFVLTAAHCTTSNLGSPSVVRLGEHNLVRGDDGAHPVDYLVKEVVRHPDYHPPKRYNDIALLRLSRHVSFTTNIRPACLYSLPTFNTGKTVATGWGRIQYAEEQSDVLLKVVLSIIDNELCNGFYKTESKMEILSQGITHKQMCAGELTGGKDTCQGDSGGPIEVTSQGNKCVHHVIGVTSFGKRCGQPNAPGVYTRVSAYVPWIEQIVWPEHMHGPQKIRNFNQN